MSQTVNMLEEWAYLLENDPKFQLNPSDVLHALDPRLAETNRFMPKGMTKADHWQAVHGNPLKSVDAAMFLVNEIVGPATWGIRVTGNKCQVVMAPATKDKKTPAKPIDAVAHDMPSAIMAALMTHQVERKGV